MSQELTMTHPTNTALQTQRAARVSKYLNESMSTSTRRVYRIQWATFGAFCTEHGYTALPAEPAAVVDFITHLADQGRKPSTIQQVLASIGYMHETSKHANPTKSLEVRETMKGIRRKLGTMQKPKAALSPVELSQIVATLPDDLRGARDRALLLIGWQGAFRRSELVALNVEDIDTRDGKMTITIRKSKTDQEGAGLYKVLPELEDKRIDPIATYRAWLSAADIKSGTVFRSIDQWGHTRTNHMDGKEVARIVKRACSAAGIDPVRFAGHSLRSGFVTAASNAGANDSDVMEQTGHKSSATLRRYKQMAGRGAQRATLAALGIVK